MSQYCPTHRELTWRGGRQTGDPTIPALFCGEREVNLGLWENRPEAMTQPWGPRRDSKWTKAVSRALKERMTQQANKDG